MAEEVVDVGAEVVEEAEVEVEAEGVGAVVAAEEEVEVEEEVDEVGFVRFVEMDGLVSVSNQRTYKKRARNQRPK